jgi:hypothetical protein
MKATMAEAAAFAFVNTTWSSVSGIVLFGLMLQGFDKAFIAKKVKSAYI